ncbi:MAG TPA: helix-turn-helix transcriptional regulator [Candidatus Angelobacter sp.]|nr:helix-turn-helix transcriptional regulator [Candidatus Angelobacter sp.]
MSRNRLTTEDFEFAKLIGRKLNEAIEAHALTRDEAAEVLGVHRSMLYKYLSGKNIPGSTVLRRACEKWGITLDYRGITVDVDYFKEDNGAEGPRRSPIQAVFPFVRESFNGEYAQIDIRKKKHAQSEILELRMSVRLGTSAILITSPRKRTF